MREFKDYDEAFTLEEINNMKEEEIDAYNNNPNHKRKIRDKLNLIAIGFLPFIFLSILSNRTQKSQRNYIMRVHFVAYAIVLTFITIIGTVA